MTPDVDCTYSFDTSLGSSLRVRAAIESLEGERSIRADIGTELPKEALQSSYQTRRANNIDRSSTHRQISLVSKLLEEARDAEHVAALRRRGGRHAIE